MSMAKQIFYHNLRKGNKTEVDIYNRDIKSYVEKEKRRRLAAIKYLLGILINLRKMKKL